MIYALSVILWLLWLLDPVTTLTADGLPHILLFVAAIAVLNQLISACRAF